MRASDVELAHLHELTGAPLALYGLLQTLLIVRHAVLGDVDPQANLCLLEKAEGARRFALSPSWL